MSEHGLEPDPRSRLIVGKLDFATGETTSISPELLRQIADEWPDPNSVPDGIRTLLKTSRDLFVHSYFVYEFLALGVLVSLQAVETSLRVVVGNGSAFQKLIDQAEASGLIDTEQAEVLHAGRKLRNSFSHPQQQAVWPHGLAQPAIRTSHEIIADLFDRHGEATTQPLSIDDLSRDADTAD